MTEPANETYDVAIIVGSERSDAPIVRASELLHILNVFGLTYIFCAISAHRHARQLLEFCERVKASMFICPVGMLPGLPGAVAAATNQEKPVIGVALPNAEVDPDGSKCLIAMSMQPPDVPVLVAGVGKTGLKKAGIAAAQFFALYRDDVRSKFTGFHFLRRPDPNFNLDAPKEAT